MAKRNGGIIGPSNVPTGQYGGTASGVWRLRDAFNYIKAGLWPGSASYPVGNSLRFNSGSSDNLERTFGTPTSGTTWSINFWVKKASNGSAINLCSRLVDGSNEDRIRFTSGDALEWSVYKSGSYAGQLVTTQLFRDNSAWYNILCVWDTSNATAGNRMRMYLNGSEITAFSTDTNPTQNTTSLFNASGSNHRIGSVTSGEYFNGYMSDVALVDGQALTPSSFGQTDSATGIWTPLPFTGTFGTNGFFLKFANSAALGTDSSGNGNTWTVNNLTSVDQMTDTPTLNYCTLNPLMKSTSDVVLTQGNLNMVSNFAGGWQNAGSTFAVKTGKWYWEAKATVVSATDKTSIGVIEFDTTQVDFIGNTNKDLASFGISGHGAGTGGYTYAQGDIIMCAMDVTNNKVYWGKNGTFYGTLDPAAGTGTVTQTINNNNFCMPVVGGYGGSTWEMNFGIPQFTVSSGNSDANGYGNFEYAVPSGFYALNTKNLADYG
jgi:hypothetical protein